MDEDVSVVITWNHNDGSVTQISGIVTDFTRNVSRNVQTIYDTLGHDTGSIVPSRSIETFEIRGQVMSVVTNAHKTADNFHKETKVFDRFNLEE